MSKIAALKEKNSSCVMFTIRNYCVQTLEQINILSPHKSAMLYLTNIRISILMVKCNKIIETLYPLRRLPFGAMLSRFGFPGVKGLESGRDE